jgi:hypothetical protein
MSFLSGIISLGKSAVGILSGNGIAGTLARTAILGFAINRLSKNAIKGNDTGTQNIDQGVRLQVKPNADSKIPVLYGSAFFGGNIIDAAMTNSNKTMWYALALSEKTGTIYSSSAASTYVLNNVYWNNQRIIFRADGITADYSVDKSGVIDRNISGLVRVYFYSGGRTAGQVPSGYTGTVPNAETLFPNWTAGTHAFGNVIFALVRVDYSREKNVTGLGEMLFNVSNTMFQPGDVLYDYLTNTTYGAGIDAANVLTTDITALNTYSAQGVAYDDQGTGAETLADRYQINGLIDTKNPVLQNAEAILNATASWLSYDTHEGKWGVVINKADTSTASFDDSNIIGSISLNGTGLQDLYNSVKVQFPHRELRDSADFYNIAVPTSSIPADWTPFSRNTNEEDNTLELTYDIINEPIQAQMLGLIELKQSRIDKIIQFQTDFGYYNIKAGDIIDVTNTRFGFSSKLFRVINITEVQEDGGALQMSITALEYDVNVYSIADLFRFTRSDIDGIIPLGAIGAPGTPVVTKIEQDARPRVEISTTAPTGLVEGVEYWLTTDVSTGDDALRSYTLIATKKPVGGGVYTSGTAVVLDYDNLGTTNFFVKTRGFNTTTVGPFSSVSGLVEFAPVQTTNAIDANTQAFDSTGALLGALALTQLLGKLADLFTESDLGKSIFDKIFETFEDVTGIDLVGDAAAGDLVVASDLAIKADGTSLGATTASIDFIGPIEASGSSDIEVKLKDGTADKDILAWDAENGIWRTISGCIVCDFPVIPEPPAPPTPCSLTVSSTLPANNFGGVGSLCGTNSDVPFTGSYFIKFAITRGTLEGGAPDTSLSTEFTAALVKGTGSFKLYGTDGKLEDTKAIGACTVHGDVIEIPFSSRAPGKDFYVIWDEGIVTSCTCENAAVDNATAWTFTTSISPVAPYLLSAIGPVTIPAPSAESNSDSRDPADTLAVDFTTTPGSTVCSNAQKIILTFSQKVKKGTGFITLKNTATGSTISTFAVSSSTITQVGNNFTVDFGTISTLEEGVSFDLSAPRGLLLTDNPVTTTVVCDKSTTTPALPDRPSRAKNWSFITGAPLVITNVEVCTTPTGKATLTSNIKITFNKSIGKGTGDIVINDGGFFGTVQKIDINGTYANKKYATITGVASNILTINPTKAFTPNTDYHITMASGVLLDTACNVVFDGVSDTTTISWKTDGAAPTAPQGLNFGTVRFDLEYDRPITLGSGKMNVVAADGTLLTQISPLDFAVKIKYNERF